MNECSPVCGSVYPFTFVKMIYSLQSFLNWCVVIRGMKVEDIYIVSLHVGQRRIQLFHNTFKLQSWIYQKKKNGFSYTLCWKKE